MQQTSLRIGSGRQSCTVCGTNFVHTAEQLSLFQKFGMENPPSQCLTCRHKHRLSFRNGRVLYRRKCDFSGESTVSVFAPDKPYKVYRTDIWWSDQWNPLDYGRDFDFSRPFFEQFHDLQLQVPRPALANIKPENSPFCNMCEGNKNCYLICGGDFNADCMYGMYGMHNRNVMDCDGSNDSEYCYFMSDSFECYGCRFAFDSKNCSNCAFISDCTGCTECILCTNLVQKKYCIENEELPPEEYKKRKAALLNGTYSQQQRNWEKFLAMRAKRIAKYAHILNCEDCIGDYVVNSKDCKNCFDVWDCEDLIDVILASKTKDTFHSTCIGDDSVLCFNMQSTVDAYECSHSYLVYNSSNVEYSDHIGSSKNIFGCVGLHRNEECIFNKQYSKEEYGKLRSKMIDHMKEAGEWGQFLPKECSCFGYNESTANDYFPLTKKEALAQGFSWYHASEEKLSVEKSIPAAKLPDAIDDIPDDILNWAVICEKSKKPFRIIKQELNFYRTHAIPVPHLSFEERHLARLALRTPKELFERTCDKCGTVMQSAYAPERPETVYCESCYLAEVY